MLEKNIISKDQVIQKIKEILESVLRIDVAGLLPDTPIINGENSFDFDSIDKMEILTDIEIEYGIDLNNIPNERFATVGSIADLVLEKITTQLAKVYVKGYDCKSVLGNTADENWENLIAGKKNFSYDWNGKFQACYPHDTSKVDYISEECVEVIKASLEKSRISDLSKTCLIYATCCGGLSNLDKYQETKNEEVLKEVLPNQILTSIVQKLDFKNFNIAVVNSCSSGILAIDLAAKLLENRFFTNAIVIGADVLSKIEIIGFNGIKGLATPYCQPFIASNGLSLGESVACVILTSKQSFIASSQIRILGRACTNDAYAITAPNPDCEMKVKTIKKAISQSGLLPSEIQYANVHGTGTQHNDTTELNALSNCFKHVLKKSKELSNEISSNEISSNEVSTNVESLQNNGLLLNKFSDGISSDIELNSNSYLSSNNTDLDNSESLSTKNEVSSTNLNSNLSVSENTVSSQISSQFGSPINFQSPILFGQPTNLDIFRFSSTKGQTGHCLGATGILESIFCVKSIEKQVLLPGFDLDLSSYDAKNLPVQAAINMNYAFGGTNSAIVFSRKDPLLSLKNDEAIKNYSKEFSISVEQLKDKKTFIDFGIPESKLRKCDVFSQLVSLVGSKALLSFYNEVKTEYKPIEIGSIVYTESGPINHIKNFSENIYSGKAPHFIDFQNTVYNAAQGYLMLLNHINGYNLTVMGNNQSEILDDISEIVLHQSDTKVLILVSGDENTCTAKIIYR